MEPTKSLVALLLDPRYKIEVQMLLLFGLKRSHYESMLQGVPICERSLYKEVPHKAQGLVARNI